jgi:transcriptional regulator with XRE-family HTH domain
MEEKNLETIGTRIKALRKEKSLSQQEVADLLGVQRPTYSKIEGGQIIPTVKHIIKLSGLFQVSIDWLLTGAANPQASLPDFGVLSTKISQMLDHMAKNEGLLHFILSQYYTRKAELTLYEMEKQGKNWWGKK